MGDDQDSGAASLLIAVIGVVLVAIGAQLPEIERYLKVRVM